MQAIALLALKLICKVAIAPVKNRFQDGIIMNQRDGFTGGFIAGTIVGGILGGAIGALLVRDKADLAISERRNNNLSDANHTKRQRRFKAANEQSIEMARRSLEDKIAQLNETIDEVRLTLGQVNSSKLEEPQLTEEP